MSRRAGPLLSRSLLAGLVLSSIGAKGCLGGDVSLGNDGSAGAAGRAGNGNGNAAGAGGSALGMGGSAAMPADLLPGAACQLPLDLPACSGLSLGYNFDPQQGKCLPYCSSSAYFASLQACQTACQAGSGSGGAAASEAPLALDPSAHVTSSAEFGVSGPFYPFSDAAGVDGSSATGDCELARHSVSECANVTTPPYDAAGIPDWSIAGLMCTSGSVERVLDIVGAPGMADYGSMWGAGIAFNFSGDKLSYDASAHGVVGIAFDIDQVPARGVRVELLTPATVNRPAAWKPEAGTQGYTSPLHVGRNVVLFQDVAPLPFYDSQSSFDPTQIVSVQFHVPTTTEPAAYAFCISNLALVLGTPAPRTDPVNGACPPSLKTDSGFAYESAGMCLSPFASVLACSPLGNPDAVVPATPAVANLPCARRLSDGALFVALDSTTGPLAWQTLPASSWAQLSATEWADCSAEEAALVAAASVCPIIPL